MRHVGIGLALAAGIALAAVTAGAAERYHLLRLDGAHLKWGEPALGTGAVVTYAFIEKTTDFPGARNCRSMEPVDPIVAQAGVSVAAFRYEVEAALAMWSAAANIEFQAIAAPERAQILIGADTGRRGAAYADVAYRKEPVAATVSYGTVGETPVRPLERSLVCLNPAKPWKVGFDGNIAVYDIRYAIAHEVGHAIGLDHPGPTGQVMSFSYREQFRVLQPGDIAGAVALYGRRGGPIVTASPTAPLPLPGSGPSLVPAEAGALR